MPFEAVNLNAVDISIIKIFENNVPQFFQDNNLGGNADLRRVAKPIVQKTLRLDDDKTFDLHKHQYFSLDIDKFLKNRTGCYLPCHYWLQATVFFVPGYRYHSKKYW